MSHLQQLNFSVQHSQAKPSAGTYILWKQYGSSGIRDRSLFFQKVWVVIFVHAHSFSKKGWGKTYNLFWAALSLTNEERPNVRPVLAWHDSNALGWCTSKCGLSLEEDKVYIMYYCQKPCERLYFETTYLWMFRKLEPLWKLDNWLNRNLQSLSKEMHNDVVLKTGLSTTTLETEWRVLFYRWGKLPRLQLRQLAF